MSIYAFGAFAGAVSIPGAISRYYWIRPELTQAALKILAKGSLVSLAMQVTTLACGGFAALTAKHNRQEDKRFFIGYTIAMIASIPVTVAIAGQLNFKLSCEEAVTTAVLSWASIIGLAKLLD